MADNNLGGNEEVQTCWICFGTEADSPNLEWVHPCHCRGSSKWVHHSCLLIWIEQKLKENRLVKPKCPQCRIEYVLIFPQADALTNLLQTIDNVLVKSCPVIAAGVTVGIIYWAASSFGAFTVIQVMGECKGLDVMERTEPMYLLLVLPCIPTMLISLHMVQWEESLLSFLRRGSKLPFLKYISPSYVYSEVTGRKEIVAPPSKTISSTRLFVGALAFPTFAKMMGEALFPEHKSSIKRFFWGGLSFILIRGLLKMYYLQRSYVLHSRRRVLNLPLTLWTIYQDIEH